MLDAWLPRRTQRQVCAVPSVFLGRLEFLQEQGGGQEPAGASVATGCGRETGGGERRLRPTVVREAHHPEDLGGRRPPEGDALPLSKSVQSSNPVDRRVAGASEDRPTDLHAGHPDKNVPEIPSGRSDGKDAGLGGRRVRRLHAELTENFAAMARRLVAWPLRRASANDLVGSTRSGTRRW